MKTIILHNDLLSVTRIINKKTFLIIGNVKQASVTYSPDVSGEQKNLGKDEFLHKLVPSLSSDASDLIFTFTPFINAASLTLSLEQPVNDETNYSVKLSIIACFEGRIPR